MFYIQHRIGAQSNVLLSAHYAPTTPNGRLSTEAVYYALRNVIQAYPELSLIGVPRASDNGKKHLLVLAALHEIDLETCVEFLDDHEPTSGPEILERLHNEWLWTDETFNPRNPWWKIVVLGRQEVVFVFHHIVCDGRFGHFFHRKFLEAINSFDQDQKPVARIVKIDPERVRLSKETEQFWVNSLSALRMAHIFLMFLLIRLFFGSRLFFSDLPKAKPYANSFLLEAVPHQRTKTRIASVRIPAAKMRQIIAACREQKASFTPLLLAMICCTLAIDHYPEAKIGISNCALDVRSLYPENTDSSGKLLQCAAGIRKVTCYNISINVAGVEGGDTVINASYEDGIIAEDMVYDILEGALERMEAIL
ncbi:hypothetical protein FSOLCH5_007885 [Fusarium solani]